MASNTQPLAGKRIVVTRTPQQAGELVELLQAQGAEVLLLPAVSFGPPEDVRPLDAAIRHLISYDWLLLTSQNAARYFCVRCRELGLDPAAFAGAPPRVAVVGPATADAARQEGLQVRHVAARHSSQALVDELSDVLTGKKVLLPRSDRAGAELPAALRRAGAQVTDVVAYRTLRPGAAESGVLERILCGEADVATFASPSAFHSFAEQVGHPALRQLSARMLLAAIGPVTARAIRNAGFAVAIEAADSTAAGLAAAIVSHWSRVPGTPTGAVKP